MSPSRIQGGTFCAVLKHCSISSASSTPTKTRSEVGSFPPLFPTLAMGAVGTESSRDGDLRAHLASGGWGINGVAGCGRRPRLLNPDGRHFGFQNLRLAVHALCSIAIAFRICFTANVFNGERVDQNLAGFHPVTFFSTTSCLSDTSLHASRRSASVSGPNGSRCGRSQNPPSMIAYLLTFCRDDSAYALAFINTMKPAFFGWSTLSHPTVTAPTVFSRDPCLLPDLHTLAARRPSGPSTGEEQRALPSRNGDGDIRCGRSSPSAVRQA